MGAATGTGFVASELLRGAGEAMGLGPGEKPYKKTLLCRFYKTNKQKTYA